MSKKKPKDDKPDTKFRPCRDACGRTVWSDRPVMCEHCTELAEWAARVAAVRRAAARRVKAQPAERVGSAYLRGLGVLKTIRGY